MKCVFDIVPEPQGRPRFARRGKIIQTYDPPKSRKFKKELRQLAEIEHSKSPYKAKQRQPIIVKLKIYRPMLKSFSKIKHLKAVEGILRPSTKPDIDNYIKGVLDSLNGLFWHDDGQIVELHVGKYYSDRPRIEMEIKEIGYE